MEMRILKKRDLQEALALVWQVFSEFEAPEYPEEGIRTFRAFIEKDQIAEQIKHGTMHLFGCFEGKKIQGVVALRNQNHLSLLFVSRETQRQGIGRMLVLGCKDFISEKGITAMTVNSSPYAVEFYHCMGFCDLQPEQLQDGIRYTPMKWEWEAC